MYAIRWKGKASDYGYEVMNVRYSISGGLKFETVKINIVTLGKEKADSMVEWFKDRVGMEMEVKEIQVSPLPFEN